MLKGITDAIIWIKKSFLHIMMTYLIYLMVIIIAGFLFKMLPDIAKVSQYISFIGTRVIFIDQSNILPLNQQQRWILMKKTVLLRSWKRKIQN